MIDGDTYCTSTGAGVLPLQYECPQDMSTIGIFLKIR